MALKFSYERIRVSDIRGKRCCGKDPLSPDGICQKSIDSEIPPPGWRFIIIIPSMIASMDDIYFKAERDGILCPQHVAAVDALLYEKPKLTPDKTGKPN